MSCIIASSPFDALPASDHHRPLTEERGVPNPYGGYAPIVPEHAYCSRAQHEVLAALWGQADLHVHIGIEHGVAARTRYWEIFEELRDQLRK